MYYWLCRTIFFQETLETYFSFIKLKAEKIYRKFQQKVSVSEVCLYIVSAYFIDVQNVWEFGLINFK